MNFSQFIREKSDSRKGTGHFLVGEYDSFFLEMEKAKSKLTTKDTKITKKSGRERIDALDPAILSQVVFSSLGVLGVLGG